MTGPGIDELAQQIFTHCNSSPSSKRTLISISGIPGAGKSTLARKLAERLNQLNEKRTNGDKAAISQPHADLGNPAPHTFAIDIPMDGFHLSRAQLAAMPDPKTAIHRRGAAFTYDSDGYYGLVAQLAEPVSQCNAVIYAPSFDHATKDPVADSIMIGSGTRIVVLEGNYVNLNREPWSTASAVFDFKLAAGVNRSVAKQRLIKRHVLSGICPDESAARYRVESTDELNAQDVLANEVDGVLAIVFEDQPEPFT